MPETPAASPRHTNRLVNETSPYLLQHAHNPVDWYPWGEEAFAAARARDVPIFLSIGYSTCYWCHVMERRVFENEALASKMNERFVNIKVDREERPDLDDLYMTATQIMTQRGGWPMSAFLTPPGTDGEGDAETTPLAASGGSGGAGGGLKPFWCGTYIPPEPQHGMPGFGQVLDALSAAWRDQRDEVIEQADRVTDAVRRVLGPDAGDEAGGDEAGSQQLGIETVQSVANALLQMYDQEHGGFGSAPKFPQPANVGFLLGVYETTGNEPLWPVIHHTLDRMARGGVYDQVGGGFHRYSVDAKWLVPHFEKMLYDNGQLAELYAAAYEAKPDEPASALYRRIALETCDYVVREMTDDTGAFWSAQDAEVDGREGDNYVWTREQVIEALSGASGDASGDDTDASDLAGFAVKMYGLDLGPNFQDPHPPAGYKATPVNVLFLPQPLSQLTEELGVSMSEVVRRREAVNRRLLAVRDQRKQPRTDDKVIAAWNGMMIAGMAKAGRIFDRDDLVAAAARAADAVLEHMSTDDGGLYRTLRNGETRQPAYLEDYAHFAHGLLELHRARPEGNRYLEEATRLIGIASQRFGAPRGGYFDTLADQADLLVRNRSTHDGATPSGNSQMVHDLLDLHAASHDERWLQLAALDLRSAAGELNRQGGAMIHMTHALLRLLSTAPSLATATGAGESSDADEASASSLPDPVTVSADREAVTLGGGDEARLRVTLDIDDGYHVNAHEPASDWLVATELGLRGGSGLAVEASYPEPSEQALAFADEPVRVYEGRVEIDAALRKTGEGDGVEPGELVVTYQACDDSRCLPPRTVTVPVTLHA